MIIAKLSTQHTRKWQHAADTEVPPEYVARRNSDCSHHSAFEELDQCARQMRLPQGVLNPLLSQHGRHMCKSCMRLSRQLTRRGRWRWLLRLLLLLGAPWICPPCHMSQQQLSHQVNMWRGTAQSKQHAHATRNVMKQCIRTFIEAVLPI